MKRWLFMLSASATLIAAVAVFSWAGDGDKDKDKDSSPLTSIITGDTREFTFNLNVVPNYEIRPEVPAVAGGTLPAARVQLWAFACRSSSNPLPPDLCGPLVDPTLPGPLLHVSKGDLVRLIFKNTHEKPHTIHLHGFHRNNVDGVHPVAPHENFLIEFVANPCGTYVYHCHINTPLHQDRGMYGQFIVDCPDSDPEPTVQHEFLMVVDEQPRDWPALGDDPSPETHEYIINGKAFVGPVVLGVPDPLANNIRTILGDGTVVAGPMVVHTGDTVRIRLSSFGMANHKMELVGPLPLPSAPVAIAVRQGSNPVLERPASIPEPPLEVVTNH
ncbi:MAG: multicopper oxidase domain-containing protein, partial [Nitrospirales bacterium]